MAWAVAPDPHPVLMVHGEDDTNVPPSARRSTSTVRSAGTGPSTSRVIYPREGHGFAERNHQLDLPRRTRAWFDRWLRDETLVRPHVSP